MYRRRAFAGGAPTTMQRRSFKALLIHAGLSNIDAETIFVRNLGFTDPARPRYELEFEHFLDALRDVAHDAFPGTDDVEAIQKLLGRNIHPLYVRTFGDDGERGEDTDIGGGDGQSVVTSRTTATARARRSLVVLTVDGSAPSTAQTLGPKVPLSVMDDSSPPPGSATVRRRPSVAATGSSSLAIRVGDVATATSSLRNMGTGTCTRCRGTRSVVALPSCSSSFTPSRFICITAVLTQVAAADAALPRYRRGSWPTAAEAAATYSGNPWARSAIRQCHRGRRHGQASSPPPPAGPKHPQQQRNLNGRCVSSQHSRQPWSHSRRSSPKRQQKMRGCGPEKEARKVALLSRAMLCGIY